MNNPAESLTVSLKQIKAMRPFVEDGGIKIAAVRGNGIHPSRVGEYSRVMMQAGGIMTQVEEERARLDSIDVEIWDEARGKTGAN